MHCHRPLLHLWNFSPIALCLLLASCQGTLFGETFERAVAPSTPQTSPLESPSPEIPDPEIPNSDPLPQDQDLSARQPPPELSVTPSPSPTPTAAPPSSTAPSPERENRFSDLRSVPQAAEAIGALDELEVFADINSDRFQPNRSVRRQEFARWAVVANNRLYDDVPARQLALATETESPLFLDVPEDHPNFSFIQALANAGILEVRSDREFEPNKLLSRADLLAIKLALDIGTDSITGTARDVERDWGFSDVADIPPNAIAAIAADFTLGQESNIRRTFGSVAAFTPQAPVTRAEVAIALSSFGIGDNLRSAVQDTEGTSDNALDSNNALDSDNSALPDVPAPKEPADSTPSEEANRRDSRESQIPRSEDPDPKWTGEENTNREEGQIDSDSEDDPSESGKFLEL